MKMIGEPITSPKKETLRNGQGKCIAANITTTD
jgi:hypothetical protein